MIYRKHQPAIDYINILMQFLIAYLTMTVILYLFDTKAPLRVLVVLPAPFLSYLIRRHTSHIWSFLLCHIVLAAVYLPFSRSIYYITAFVIYLLVLTSISYYIRHRKQDLKNTSLFLLLYFLFLYVSCYLVDFKELLPLCFALAVSYTMLYIINHYLLNLDRFVCNHAHIVNIPFRQIRNTNHILMAFLCCLLLLSMLCFSKLPFGSLLALLGSLLFRILRSLVTWLSRLKVPEEEWAEEQPEPSRTELPMAEPSRFMEILSAIFQWTITIALIIGTVILILYTIYKIYQHFYLKGEAAIKDEVEFLSPFERKEKLFRKQGKLNLHLFGRSNNGAIRKYFAKAVIANAGSEPQLSKSLTPSQLSEYAVLSGEYPSSEREDRMLVTSCYEKARYSNEACTREEVQQVKKLLKANKKRDKNKPIQF